MSNAARNSQGIQQLLAAEKRAAEKVAEARKRKTKRIKQARDEAEADIELYRRERERLFREYEAKYMGSREDVAAKINKDTEKLMQDMAVDVENNKPKVISELVTLVCAVDPQLHPNYKILHHFNKM